MKKSNADNVVTMEKDKKIIYILAVIITMSGVQNFFSQANKSALEYFDEGLNAQNTEDWYSASESFMEAVKKNPVYSEAWFHLSQCSYQLGEYDLAISQLDECEKLSPDDNAIRNLRAMIYITQYKFDEAKEILNDILKKSPNNIDARFGLAELDLFNGRTNNAIKQYLEALKRQHDNRKALLSLAVLSAQMGRYDNALRYASDTIDYYSGEKEVHYLVAIIHSMKGDLDSAERSCRVALEIKPEYDKAQELLSKILFMKGQYEDVIAICNKRLEENRAQNSAWYLKGTAQKKLGDSAAAIASWDKGLSLVKDDEIMRAALETLIAEKVPLNDPRRKTWARYHIDQARQCERRYDKAGGLFEYQRALKIEPTNEEARLSYANMLKLNNLNELYLEQLLFIEQNKKALEKTRKRKSEEKSIDKTSDSTSKKDNEETKKPSYKDTLMSDTIEAYEDLLQDTLAKKWGVEPFFLDKTRWRLGVYYESDESHSPLAINQLHVLNNAVAADYASDIFSGIASTAVRTYPLAIKGFGDAYNKARNSSMDYFVTITLDEGERDLTLGYELYSARTGNKIGENTFYSTGNNRYTNVFRRLQLEILESLTVRGNIIAREGKTLLCDIGHSEGALSGDKFDIIKIGNITTATSQKGVLYKKENILGTFVIDEVGEEVSSGTLEYKGFYDKINIGDEIVLTKRAEEKKTDTPPAPSANGQGEPTQKENLSLLGNDVESARAPSILDLIRNIY